MLEHVQGHIAEAIRYYEMGLQKAPTDLDLLYRLKSTYLDIGDYDKALEVALIEAKYTPDVSQRQAEIRLMIRADTSFERRSTPGPGMGIGSKKR